MFCPHCGKQFEDGKFCPFCGAEMPGQVPTQPQMQAVSRFCPTCGRQVTVEQTCPDCGAQIPGPVRYEPVPVIIAETVQPAQEKPAKVKKPKAEKPPKEKKPKAEKGEKTFPWKILLIVTAAVLVLAAIGACLWFFVFNKDEDGKKDNNGGASYLQILDINVEQRDIETKVKTDVKVTVQTNGETEYESLMLVDENGNELGELKDDGSEADSYAEDHVYSAEIEFSSEEPATWKLFVSDGSLLSSQFETVYFYPAYDPDAYQNFVDVQGELRDVLDYSDDLEADHEIAMQMLGQMLNDGKVSNYSFNNGSIQIQLTGGGTYVYSYNPGGDWKTGESGSAEGGQDLPISAATMYSITPNTHKVATLQPYRDELGAGGVDDAANSVANSGYNFVFTQNADGVTAGIEMMKTLNEYNVILLDGHGGYSPELHSFIGTGTRTSSELDEVYWPDIYYDRIIKLSGGNYGVTSAFFDRYYEEGDFGECIVYLGCCHGADDWVLADTLKSKGVDAIFAYRNTVTVSYDANMVRTILEELSKDAETPVTVAEALEAAQAQHGATDDSNAHWYNWLLGNYESEENRAALKLYGDTRFSLDMKSNSMRGKVAQSGTGEPLVSAVVTAHDTETDTAMASTRTDADGNFVMPLAVGSYHIVVRSSGYMPCTVSDVAVERNATTYLQNTILLELAEGNPQAIISGTVTNAVTGNPVEGVTIRFRENYNNVSGDYVTKGGEVLELVTDDNGYYFTEQLFYGYYTAEISKEGFVTSTVNVVASYDDSIAYDQNMLITPEASGNDFRITLEWAENPRDEDAHIVCESPDDYHVYYRNKSEYRDGELIANLDHDDMYGNGFETVTMTVDPEGTYRYYVHHYAGSESLSTSNAIVKVYQGGVLIGVYNVPIDQGTGIYWHVFDIVNGQVVVVNRITDSSAR